MIPPKTVRTVTVVSEKTEPAAAANKGLLLLLFVATLRLVAMWFQDEARGHKGWLPIVAVLIFAGLSMQCYLFITIFMLAWKKRTLAASQAQIVATLPVAMEPVPPASALVDQHKQWWTDTGTRDDIQQQGRKG